MNCTNCGSKLEDGAAFCPACGAAQTLPAAPSAPVKPVRPGRRLSKGAIIGIIAAAVLVVAAAVLILVLGGRDRSGNKPAERLIGVWTCNEELESSREKMPPWELFIQSGARMRGTTSTTETNAKGPRYKLTFREDGTGTLQGSAFSQYDPVVEPNGYAVYFTVDEDNTLVMNVCIDMPRLQNDTYDYTFRFTYSEDAKDGDENCWYLDGDALYLGSMKYKRQG